MLKITIITVCYNEKQKIRDTIESVRHQSYPHIEYLIMDGASTDGTLDILQEYSGYENIQIYSEKDRGIYHAMNRGIARANGDYIYFMNAGDTFYDAQVISQVVSCIGEEKETIYYGKTCKIYADGLRQIEDLSKLNMSLEEVIADGNMPCHQSIFSPRKILTDHYFREQYKIRADYEWFLYSITRGCSYEAIPIVIGCYEVSGISSRVKNMRLLKMEEKKILKEYENIFIQKQIRSPEHNISDMKAEVFKYTLLFQLTNYWLVLKQRKLSVGKFLKQKGYGHIAIYGMSHLGMNLLEELKEGEVRIDYAIDKNADHLCVDMRIVSPEKELDEVDLIIITALDYYHEIKEKIESKIHCPIISLEDILFEMGQMARL